MTSKPHLLVVDDEAGIRESLSSILKDEGYHVEAVASAEEALQRASSGDLEVILLDVWLPGLDGLAVAGVLAQEVPCCRSLILTTFGRPGYLRRAMESGASGFVVKDAPPERLAEAIRRVAAGQRVAQDPAQRLQGVQVRARADQPDRPAPELLAERQPQFVALPHPAQPGGRAGRVGGHERAVEGADRGTDHQVGPDAGLGQRAEHADLMSAEQPPAAQYERRGHSGSLASRRRRRRREPHGRRSLRG